MDFACSNDDGEESPGNGDGDGDDDINVPMGGEAGDGDGDGDGDAPRNSCSSFNGLESCDTAGATASRREVNLLLVIDKSGSMDDDGGFDNTKWETMRAALSSALQEVAPELNFGLLLYPYPGNELRGIDKEQCPTVGNCCEMPSSSDPQVPVGSGVDTVPLILDEFDDVRPGGGTPTAVALQQAYDYYVDGPGADLEGDKYVVLATDGGPNCNEGLSCDASSCNTNIEERGECTADGENCCTGGGTVNCLDDEASNDAVSLLNSAGIDTFVIGIPGSEAYEGVLDGWAEEGGRALEGEDNSYFQVQADGGVEGLTDVFRSITRDLITSCDIQLDAQPQNPQEINVAVDCDIVPQFGEDGGGGAGGQGGGEEQWILDSVTDPPTIRLRGDVCERVQTEGVERVDVVLGCRTIL